MTKNVTRDNWGHVSFLVGRGAFEPTRNILWISRIRNLPPPAVAVRLGVDCCVEPSVSPKTCKNYATHSCQPKVYPGSFRPTVPVHPYWVPHQLSDPLLRLFSD